MNKPNNRKKIGTQAENELLRLFWERGFAAMRSAGSGSMRYPGPDLLVGNGLRVLAIECKKTKKAAKYFPKKEIEGLEKFARAFGAEPVVGIKFLKEPWYLIPTEDLLETEKSRMIRLKEAKLKGFLVEEI